MGIDPVRWVSSANCLILHDGMLRSARLLPSTERDWGNGNCQNDGMLRGEISRAMSNKQSSFNKCLSLLAPHKIYDGFKSVSKLYC